jgi:hypothetical protein
MRRPKKKFGIYHWDTFDNVTTLVGEADTVAAAEKKITKDYDVSSTGADVVEIVDKVGNRIRRFQIR